MAAVKLSVTITPQHKVIARVPEGVSAGDIVEVELSHEELLQLLEPADKDTLPSLTTNSTREVMRAKMAAAGILGSVELPPNMHVPTDEERRAAQERTAALTAQHGGLRMDQIIDEERGPK